jgi:ribosome-associated protein
MDTEDLPPAPAIPTWLTRLSKTRRKKDSHDLQDLGEALVAMPDGRLVDLPMDESLLDAQDCDVHRVRNLRERRGVL